MLLLGPVRTRHLVGVQRRQVAQLRRAQSPQQRHGHGRERAGSGGGDERRRHRRGRGPVAAAGVEGCHLGLVAVQRGLQCRQLGRRGVVAHTQPRQAAHGRPWRRFHGVRGRGIDLPHRCHHLVLVLQPRTGVGGLVSSKRGAPCHGCDELPLQVPHNGHNRQDLLAALLLGPAQRLLDVLVDAVRHKAERRGKGERRGRDLLPLAHPRRHLAPQRFIPLDQLHRREVIAVSSCFDCFVTQQHQGSA
mmetsp:Transcript_14936/g.47616  ORF Transcript_14936/g.47616 Transcript_14936/m.47616 type:complete len:247 (-) Transcript_14936:25-765(-)